MHHGTVTVFNRIEDDTNVQVTAVARDSEASTVTITNETTSNPSPRRHGILIDFDCEILAIYQHKGLTLLEWVK